MPLKVDRLITSEIVLNGTELTPGGGGGGSLTVNGQSNVTNLIISPIASFSTNPGEISLTIDTPTPFELPYKAYRAKIAMQTVDWPGYGYLYNWYAVADARKLENPAGGTGLAAPNQWRVPSDTDWNTLITFVGSSGAGTKVKSTLNSTAFPFYGWLNNGGGTDDYNFTALPGGKRFNTGEFALIGNNGVWWSSFANTTTTAFIYTISSLSGGLGSFPSSKGEGLSVRLVRNATAGELLLADGDTSDTSSLDPYQGNDGKGYVTVKIGTQIWLAQNLRETKYNDNSDIFNASVLGGDPNASTWQAKGTAQEGAWTAYYSSQLGFVEYDPTTVKLFYNDVLENTLDGAPNFPIWTSDVDAGGIRYELSFNRSLNKTHIKITPGYDVSDFPGQINERSLLIFSAVAGQSEIAFRPIKRSDAGALTIEDLENYNDGNPTSYVYVEILEYTPAYYNQAVGIGLSNL